MYYYKALLLPPTSTKWYYVKLHLIGYWKFSVQQKSVSEFIEVYDFEPFKKLFFLLLLFWGKSQLLNTARNLGAKQQRASRWMLQCSHNIHVERRTLEINATFYLIEHNCCAMLHILLCTSLSQHISDFLPFSWSFTWKRINNWGKYKGSTTDDNVFRVLCRTSTIHSF